jgi:hypothetical protein
MGLFSKKKKTEDEVPVCSDPTEPAFWLQLGRGKTVILKDVLATEASIEEGDGISGLDYTVSSIKQFDHEDGFAIWRFFEMHRREEVLYLMAKLVDEDVSLVVYFETEDIEPDSRLGMLDNGMDFLFEEDEEGDTAPGHLSFVGEIFQERDDGTVVYAKKPQGELYGLITTEPRESGCDEKMTGTIVEYVADLDEEGNAPENPEFLIFEEANEDAADLEGGYVRCFLGSPIEQFDISVI